MSFRSYLVFASALLAAACGGSTPSQPAAPANPADLVIVNGKVHVADEANTVAQAVAVKGNTILKFGTTDDIKALAGPSTRVIDAKGATVTPGFTDSHALSTEWLVAPRLLRRRRGPRPRVRRP